MNGRVTLTSVGLVAAVLLVSVGCTKLTFENWQLIREGQSKIVVQKTLGEPTIMLKDNWVWNDPDRAITANVWYNAEGKVIAKQWVSAKRGDHGGPPFGKEGEVIERRTNITTVDK